MTPAGAALGVFPLAKEFGWSLDHILWELPLAILHQAHGWISWTHGAKLRRRQRGRADGADIAKKLGL